MSPEEYEMAERMRQEWNVADPAQREQMMRDFELQYGEEFEHHAMAFDMMTQDYDRFAQEFDAFTHEFDGMYNEFEMDSVMREFADRYFEQYGYDLENQNYEQLQEQFCAENPEHEQCQQPPP